MIINKNRSKTEFSSVMSIFVPFVPNVPYVPKILRDNRDDKDKVWRMIFKSILCLGKEAF
jgi:hypothetical protein